MLVNETNISTTICDDTRCERARAFLVDAALPFWSSCGVYPNGCFVEHLDLAGRPVDPGFTRTRVQARQIYVFSHAEMTGLFAQPEICARAVDFFIRACWLGSERGWAKRVSRDGTLIDGASDLYDISFALFALAWRYRLNRDPALVEIADATLDFLDTKMKHPAGGYDNDAVRSFPRLQNPHMHLAEAMSAWFESTGEKRFLQRAGEMIDLIELRISDPISGALQEYFNDDWTPIDGPQGRIVEPGHQFEWAWIIAHYGRLSGAPRLELVRRLIQSGLRHGFDEETGLTIDQVDCNGRPLAASRRLWPQTEVLKAQLAAAEFLQESVSRRVEKIVDAVFDRFLDPGPLPGTWIDHYHSNWSLIVDKIPATSLYHVTLAFSELLRLCNRLPAPSNR